MKQKGSIGLRRKTRQRPTDMTYSENLWLFFLLVSGIIIVPGMDMVFVLASSLSGGRKAGLSATFGIMAGGLVHTLYAALATLAQQDLDLMKDTFWEGKTERELAPLLGLKEPKSVNKRKHRILEILRQNEALKVFFE